MYERFTDRARKTMQLANQEAQRVNHEYIGTEHLLLGLIKQGDGVAAQVFKNLDIDLHKVRAEVLKIIVPGPETPETALKGKLPQTPRAKRVLEFAIEEARKLNHNYVGTEHLLLGLLREEEGIAAQVLLNVGLTLSRVRDEVLQLLGQPPDSGVAARPIRVQLVDADALPRRSPTRPAKEYDLYLPLHYADGSPIEPEKIASVGRRLHEQFGDLFCLRQKLEGTWQRRGVLYRGEVLRVVAEPGGVMRGFFERLKEDLMAELRQDDILIVVRDIEIV